MVTLDPVRERGQGVGGVQAVGADDEGEVPVGGVEVVNQAVQAFQDVVVLLPVRSRHRQRLVLSLLAAWVVPLEAAQVALEVRAEDAADGGRGEVARGQSESGSFRRGSNQLSFKELVIGGQAGSWGLEADKAWNMLSWVS